MTAPPRVLLFLCIGLAAASQSGNIIRLGEAHPIALAAWRLLIATVLLAPLAGSELRRIKTLSRRDALLLVLAGVFLAAHFFAWIGAVQLTTVANAAIFFSINPVITTVAGYLFFRERVGKRLFLSISLGIAGVAVIGGGDLSFNREHLAGDAAAVICSLLFTVYFLLGKRIRRLLPTAVYVTVVYGTAAVVSFACVGLIGLPLVDYTGRTWLCFFLLALLPTMIGHTSINNALRYIPAGNIATATLSEPLLAGLVAFFAWGEQVTLQSTLGYLLICLSVLVLVPEMTSPLRDRGSKGRRCTP